jgi:hypothetical protein
VTTSSQQDSYSITLNDIDISGAYTIDCNMSSSDYITITNSSISNIGTITIPPSDTFITSLDNDFSIFFPDEWVNGFPEWDRIQDMCEKYPGLKIAFEKFKTTYKLVKDDYDAEKDKK